MAMKKCGVCDNCLRQKNIELTHEEFQIIAENILSTISNQSRTLLQMMEQMHAYKRDKVWKVLDYLQAEGKILVNAKGQISH